MLKNNRELSAEFIAAALLICLLFIGACLGWGACRLTSGNKLIVADFERSIAERDYYSAQLDELVRGNKR